MLAMSITSLTSQLSQQLTRLASLATPQISFLTSSSSSFDLQLIPKDSDYVNPENLCLLLSPTSIDSLTGSSPRKKIKHFKNRDDLINVNMCSVHIPLFLDKKLTREYLNERFIDGSFQSKPSDYRFKSQHEKVVMLDYVDDERLKVRTGGFVELISKEYVWDMIEYGYTWARKRDGEGKFNSLKY